MKESTYYENCWVVHFDKKKITASIHIDSLHFESAISKSHHIVKGKGNMMAVEKVDRSNSDEEQAILRVILHSKIHPSTTSDEVTYDKLLSIFKPKYEWLTSSKLRKYVYTILKGDYYQLTLSPQDHPCQVHGFHL